MEYKGWMVMKKVFTLRKTQESSKSSLKRFFPNVFLMQPQEERGSVPVILVMLEPSWVIVYHPVTFSFKPCLMEITSTSHPQSDNLTRKQFSFIKKIVQRIFDHDSGLCTQYISMKINCLESGLFVLFECCLLLKLLS